MVPPTRSSREEQRTGVVIGDPSLPDTLEVLYLRAVLDRLPPEWRTAVDLGAGAGHFSAELMRRGIRVLGLEPDPAMAAALRLRFEVELRQRQFQLATQSAVTRGGALAEVLDAHGFREIGIARVPADGRQWSALGALVFGRADLPAIVTFGVSAIATDIALGCIRFLWARGYRTFDVFIKRGTDPVAAGRFAAPELPALWRSCGGPSSSANFIAYHLSRVADPRRLNPRRFVSDYQVLKSQHLLRAALKQEARVTHEQATASFVMDGLIASRVRSELRFDILSGGWAGVLMGRIGRHLGARAPWNWVHERRRSILAASSFGQRLVERLVEPRFGTTGSETPTAVTGLSVAMTGVLYDLMRLHKHTDGRLPRRVVEVSGGWGLAAYVYASVVRDVAFAIVDYPEALAIQHYCLTLSLPATEVIFAQKPEARLKPGTILLVSPVWLRQFPSTLAGDLVYSSKSAGQMYPSLRSALQLLRTLGAANAFIGGDWEFEGEGMLRPQRLLAA